MKKHFQYKLCHECGAHLDFGESCDCGNRRDSVETLEETKRLINRLLDRMDERQLRVMYADANRVYCRG